MSLKRALLWLSLPPFPACKSWWEKFLWNLGMCLSSSRWRVAVWTSVWFFTEKCKRQECGVFSWSKVGAKDAWEIPWSDVVIERKNRPEALLYLVQAWLSPGNRKETVTMECWGGAEENASTRARKKIECSQWGFLKGSTRGTVSHRTSFNIFRTRGQGHFMTVLTK